MNGFSPELQAKTKVNMRNMYREKRGLTRESLVLPGLLFLSSIEADRIFMTLRKKSKRTEQTRFVKKNYQKVSDIRFMCNINYTGILQLAHKDGSVEDPAVKNQTLCLLLFD